MTAACGSIRGSKAHEDTTVCAGRNYSEVTLRIERRFALTVADCAAGTIPQGSRQVSEVEMQIGIARRITDLPGALGRQSARQGLVAVEYQA